MDQIKGCGTFFEDTPQRIKTRVVGGDKGANGFGFW